MGLLHNDYYVAFLPVGSHVDCGVAWLAVGLQVIRAVRGVSAGFEAWMGLGWIGWGLGTARVRTVGVVRGPGTRASDNGTLGLASRAFAPK